MQGHQGDPDSPRGKSKRNQPGLRLASTLAQPDRTTKVATIHLVVALERALATAGRCRGYNVALYTLVKVGYAQRRAQAC